MGIMKSIITKVSFSLVVGLGLSLFSGFIPGHAMGEVHTYYVSPSGDDGNNGLSEVTPFKHIHFAIGVINAIEPVPGDTFVLNVASGTYSTTDNSEPDLALNVTKDNLTIDGDDNDKPVIDGATNTNWTYGLTISGYNIVVKDLVLKNFSNLVPRAGMKISGSFNTITYCDINNNDYGVYLQSAGDGNTILGNIVYENPLIGILVEGCSPTIMRNKMYDNLDGIVIRGVTSAASPTIWNNLIYRTGAGTSQMGRGITVQRLNAETSPSIYHNTLDNGLADGIYIGYESEGSGDINPDIRYNIITNFADTGIYREETVTGSISGDYNDVYGNTANYFNWTGLNDISLDPQYTATGHTLQASSPCIDAIPAGSGDVVTEDIVGTVRPKGSGFEMGAYEYLSGLAPAAYYVNIQTGSDSNSGYLDSPWKTLHYAIAQINAGVAGTADSAYELNIKLAGGNYYSTDNGENDSQLILSQDYVTIIGESGSGPMIDGTNALTWTKGIKITGSNVKVHNLFIKNFTDGIEIAESASNCTVSNCNLSDNSYHGIYLLWSPGCSILENVIYATVSPFPPYGIYVTGCSPQIQRNKIFDVDEGIRVVASDSDISPTIWNNLIYETQLNSMSNGIVVLSDDSFSASPRIYHNTLDNGTFMGIKIAFGSGSGAISPEIKYNIITNFHGMTGYDSGYGIYRETVGGIPVSGTPIIDYNDVFNNLRVQSFAAVTRPKPLPP